MSQRREVMSQCREVRRGTVTVHREEQSNPFKNSNLGKRFGCEICFCFWYTYCQCMLVNVNVLWALKWKYIALNAWSIVFPQIYMSCRKTGSVEFFCLETCTSLVFLIYKYYVNLNYEIFAVKIYDRWLGARWLDPWSLIFDPWSLILDSWSLILDPSSL